MTTLGIHYLTGRAVATDRTFGGAPEFPPHFGRVFMALAATYFETRGSAEERAALEWLEAAGPPSVRAGEFHPRSTVLGFVPVNDALSVEANRGAVPRSRQSRSFSSVRLGHPFVYLQWRTDIPPHLRDPLERLCNRVTRVGHSSSLVQIWIADRVEDFGDEWLPDEASSDLRMRVTERGTLTYLEGAFNAKALEEYGQLEEALQTATGRLKAAVKEQIAQRFPQGAPSSARPVLTRWQGYAKIATQKQDDTHPTHSPFDPNLIVLTRSDDEEQRVFGLEATLQLTGALRNAAMNAVGQNVPEWLSGHQPDGKPSLKPHAAFFPLPFVDAKYADGHILGLAMAVPREIEPPGETKEESLRRVLGALLFRQNGEEKSIHLWRGQDQGKLWEWRLSREMRTSPPMTLRAGTWTGPSREWASVTPVVLHHYPKKGREGDVKRILIEAFVSAGLPEPLEMWVQPVSVFDGAGHVKSMPEFIEGGDKMCRYQVHLRVRFASPVTGPLLVGRGRFRGYGLLRPLGVRRG